MEWMRANIGDDHRKDSDLRNLEMDQRIICIGLFGILVGFVGGCSCRWEAAQGGTAEIETVRVFDGSEDPIQVASREELDGLVISLAGLSTEELDRKLPKSGLMMISHASDESGTGHKLVKRDTEAYLRGDRSMPHTRIYSVEGAWEGKLFVEIRDNIVVSTKLLRKESE